MLSSGPLIALAPGRALVGGQALLKGRLRGGLKPGVEGGTHHMARGGERLDAREGARLAGEVIHEVEARIAPGRLDRDQPQGRVGGLAELRLGDDALLLHPREHVGPGARAPPVGVLVGAVEVRPLGHAGQKCRLRHAELAHRFAEVAARGHLDAVGAAPEIDAVEVEFENAGLREDVLKPRGHDSSRGSCARR